MKIFERKHIIIITNITAFILAFFMVVLQSKSSALSVVCTNLTFCYIYFLIIELIFFCLYDYLKIISKRELLVSCIGTGIIFLCVGFFIIYYLVKENDIYTWDSCVYWIKAINQEKNAYSDLKYMFKAVRETLGSQEYNDMAAVPLVPFVHYFGATFPKFVFYNYLLYYSPACIIISLYIIRVIEHGKFSVNKYLLTYFVSLVMPGLFLPLTDGYLDVIGILIIALMLHTTYDWDYTKISFSIILKVSILSLLLLLARRWYAFFIVGFYFALGVEFVLNELQNRRWVKKNWYHFFENYIFIGAICIVILLVVAPEIFELFFGGGYSNAYSAYKTRTFYQDFLDILKDFGGWFTVLAVVGIIKGIVSEYRRGKQRKWILHLTISTIVTFALFQHIQSMGEHHRYLMMPLFLMAISYTIGSLYNFIHSKIITGIWTAMITLISCKNFLNSFTPFFNFDMCLISQISEPPANRDDLEEVNHIVDYLIKETDNTNKKVYIAVDSSEFSQELLIRSKMPERISAVPAIIGANIKDTRDGFPSQAFLADYLLVAPTLENDQKIISELTKIITENEQTKQYYSLVAEEMITGGNHIYIYQKIAPMTKEFIDILSEQLQQQYIDNEFVYSPNYFVGLVNVENAEEFEYYFWLDGYYAKKPKDDNLEIFYILNSQFDTIEFDMENWNPDMRLRVYADGNIIYDEIMNYNGTSHYEFSVEGANELRIEIVGKHEQMYVFSNGKLTEK